MFQAKSLLTVKISGRGGDALTPDSAADNSSRGTNTRYRRIGDHRMHETHASTAVTVDDPSYEVLPLRTPPKPWHSFRACRNSDTRAHQGIRNTWLAILEPYRTNKDSMPPAAYPLPFARTMKRNLSSFGNIIINTVFVLTIIFLVLCLAGYCYLRSRMRRWKKLENEARAQASQLINEPIKTMRQWWRNPVGEKQVNGAKKSATSRWF